MGSIGGLLGTAGGAGGTGFKAASSADIVNGTNANQINASLNSNANALGSQQALLNALQGQNGLNAQSSVLGQQQGMQDQLAANNAIANQGNIYNQSQDLENALATYNGVTNQAGAMSAQQALNAQSAAANGIGVQSNALAQQQAQNAALAGGVNAQNAAIRGLQGVAGQQAGTAQQYQNIANGTGPNPAQAALNQSTGQNIANQAALMAGQRGAGSNVGLIARQAAQQGAATQQEAVGQGATLQAQQELNALSGLSAQQQAQAATQAQIGNVGTTQAGMQQAGIGQQANIGAGLTAAQQAGISQQGALAGQQIAQQQAQQQALASQAATQVGQQQAQQAALANQANTLAGQQIAGTTANTQAQQSEQQLLQNALASQNSQNVAMKSNINSANAGLANTTLQGQQGVIGGLAHTLGSGIGVIAKAEGGMIDKYADGTPQAPIAAPLPVAPVVAPVAAVSTQPVPQSSYAKFIKGAFSTKDQDKNKSDAQSNLFNMAGSENPGAKALQQGFGSFGPALAKGIQSFQSSAPNTGINASMAPSMSDPGDVRGMAAKGGMAKRDFTGGGNVKAMNEKQKAVKAGNSYDNDKIPAYLSEGEVVIPRNVMQSDDPVRASADFVAKVLANRRK